MRTITISNYVRCTCADKNSIDIPETSFCQSICLQRSKKNSRLIELITQHEDNLITQGEMKESLILELGYPEHLAQEIVDSTTLEVPF